MFRFFQFISYYFEDLFVNIFNGAHIFMFAANIDHNEMVSLAALDFISNIVEDYYNDELFDILVNKLNVHDNSTMFCIIKGTIIKMYKNVILI